MTTVLFKDLKWEQGSSNPKKSWVNDAWEQSQLFRGPRGGVRATRHIRTGSGFKADHPFGISMREKGWRMEDNDLLSNIVWQGDSELEMMCALQHFLTPEGNNE